MHTLRALLLASLALVSCAGPSSLAIHAGQRDYAISDDLLNGLSDPFSVGVDLVLGVLPYGIGVETSLIRSADRQSPENSAGALTQKVETLEASAGLRKSFQLESGAELYFGAGVSYLDAQFDFENSSSADFEDSDGSASGYGKIGFAWPLGPLRAGLEYRRTWGAEAEIMGTPVDLDSQLYTISIGIGF